jgi:hypothetical protein
MKGKHDMKFKVRFAMLVGLLLLIKEPPARDERGLSQSAETAILVAGAVTVALLVVGLITAFVRGKLANI